MISIIIPIYNGGRYIRQCYTSLLNQNYSDWEAIFVNDGSPDDSGAIIEEIAHIDKRVRVIHKINQGVAIAREVGINESTSEFITFLDVDDTLEPDALDVFVRELKSTDSDMVIGGINIISEQGTFQKGIFYSPRTLNKTQIITCLCTGKLRWQLWGKAYRKSLFKNVTAASGLRSAEDMAVCIQVALNANKITVLRECLYNYVQVPTSVTHSKAREISYDALKVVEFVERTVGDKMDRTSLDCLFLLIISGALRAGVSTNDKVFRAAIKKHGNLKSISRLSHLKALNIVLYKYFRINLARYL